jgi:carbamate kinase
VFLKKLLANFDLNTMASAKRRRDEPEIIQADVRITSCMQDAAALSFAAEAHTTAQQAAIALQHTAPSVPTGGGGIPLATERSVLAMIEAMLSKADSSIAASSARKR